MTKKFLANKYVKEILLRYVNSKWTTRFNGGKETSEVYIIYEILRV